MSRYIRVFPSLLYGPLMLKSEQIKPNFASAWLVFSHLPKVAKQRGTSVESIAFHAVANCTLSQAEFNGIQKMLLLQFQKRTDSMATIKAKTPDNLNVSVTAFHNIRSSDRQFL